MKMTKDQADDERKERNEYQTCVDRDDQPLFLLLIICRSKNCYNNIIAKRINVKQKKKFKI